MGDLVFMRHCEVHWKIWPQKGYRDEATHTKHGKKSHSFHSV